jgi:tellurite methyltransferase
LDARVRWNHRFAARGVRAFEQAPATWLVEHRALLAGDAGRRALDVACGGGRNAGYLAGFGFEVDAVDVSDVAIDALRVAASARGLSVHPRQMDLEQARLPPAHYDVVVQINYLQRSLFTALAQALKPGGLLMLETFTRADAERLGNDVDPDYLLEPNELLSAFPDLEVLDHREAVIEHSGAPRAVAGLVARRPPER